MMKRTRRQFLEDSMYATAAAVAAGSPSELLAAGKSTTQSPNERLGVAVIGVRGRGNTHLAVFSGRRDAQVLYVCDVDPVIGQKRVRETARRQGRRPALVDDFRRALDDPQVDIVTIAAPNHWHALAAAWAMQAGKDVYIEKPVSHTFREGRQLVDLARKTRRICQAGLQCRSNLGVIDAMRHLHSGGIGQVRSVRAMCYHRRGLIGPAGIYESPPGVDYDLWLGPAPVVPLTRPRFHHDWHWQWDYGNGELGHQAAHILDMARWGLNARHLCRSVSSFGGRFGGPDAGQTANALLAIYEFQEGALSLEVCGLPTRSRRANRIGVVFEGDDGYVMIASFTGGAAFDCEGRLVRSFRGGGDHFDNFVRAVRSRREADLTADVLEGHLSAGLGHLGNISYQQGRDVPLDGADKILEEMQAPQPTRDGVTRLVRHIGGSLSPREIDSFRLGVWLAFDPEKEMFVGNEAANRLLCRENREPYRFPVVG